MKAIKRTIAGLLATLMFVTCFNFNFAFGAEEYTKEEEIVVSKANAANVMTGTDNGFEPTKTLTRAEAAAIVVRMKGISDTQVASAKGDTLFSDVASDFWATGYINAASSMGIISGVGGGLFQPSREVTVIEFTAMATRALGAGKLVDSLGTWPTNYVNFASEEGLTDGVMRVYTAPATRMDAAFIAVNTLEADVWEKEQVTNTSEVTYQKREDKTLLSESLKITVKENMKIAEVDMKERNISLDGFNSWNSYDVVDAVALATFKPGMEVDVWAKEKAKEIVRIAPAEVSKQNEVKFNGIEKVDTTNEKITLLVNGEEKKYSYDVNTKTSFNTTKAPAQGIAGIAKDKDIFGTVILDGSKIQTIYAEKYSNKVVVKEVKNDTLYFESTSDVKGTFNNISSLDLDDDDFQFAVTKAGKEIKVTDIVEGDALYFYEDADTAKDRYVIVVNNNTVEGTVTNVADDNYIKIDGKKYELTQKIIDDNAVSISAGDEVKLYLNGRNEVTMYEMIEGAVDSTVAMVKELRAITDNYGKQKLEITLVKLDGTELETKEVDLEETVAKFGSDYADELAVVKKIYDAQAAADKFNTSSEFDESIVGQMVRYTLKGGDVVIREFLDTTINSSYDEPKIEYFTASSYNEDNGKLSGTENYRLNSNTVIYVVKKYTDSKEKYACKLEKIAYEDLGDSAAADLAGFVVGVDEDTDIVDAVLFIDSTKVKRAKDDNFAVILEKSAISDDDYSVEFELLLADGSVVEAKVEDDNNFDDFLVGDVIEVSIENGIVTDADYVADKDAATGNNYGDDNEYNSFFGYVYSFNSNGTVRMLTKQNAKATLTLHAAATIAAGKEVKIDGTVWVVKEAVTDGTEVSLVQKAAAALSVAADAALDAEVTTGADNTTGVILTTEDSIEITLAGIAGSAKNFDLAENVVFVKVDEDDADDLTFDEITAADLTKGKEGDVKSISTSIETSYEAEDADGKLIRVILAENTDANEDEIVAIFYRD